ncbi:hypothetical protein LWI29_024038 [Acer saccharum]|uniref:Leucine-rich repeat-containing N-terminal plant-type domain-containing protein n=1 Tax=Acer saccharum TaxID=4024 RepID=A0AA39VD84_ACESA|nr:hypothetical protein LWI29_024038 [Acer saccharum]
MQTRNSKSRIPVMQSNMVSAIDEPSRVLEVGTALGLDYGGKEQELEVVIATREEEDVLRLLEHQVLIFIVSLESRWSEGCLEQERFALLQLKPFFNSLHYLDNWVEGDHNSDCCQWDWVDCNNDTTGRVISLDLSYSRNSEMGEWYLNASLFSPFQQLQWLGLSYNGIAGCVENEGRLP